MAKRTITIEYDDAQKSEEMAGKPLDLLCYLQNEFDNRGITANLNEYQSAEFHDKVRDMANAAHCGSLNIQFDADARVSETDDNGAWVQGWVWVGFAGTYLDQDTEEEEEEG